MPAAKTCATLTTHCINLINKNNTWSFLLRIFEQITHTGCTDTDKHLNEVRTGNRKERNACLTSYRTSEQRFTCTRRAYQKHTLRNTSADKIKFARVLQEVNNLYKLLLLLVRTCNILKCNAFLFFVIKTRFTLTEVHHLAAAALSLIH
ncbi:hypothetical protein D3C78_1432720 [compost metagenome]